MKKRSAIHKKGIWDFAFDPDLVEHLSSKRPEKKEREPRKVKRRGYRHFSAMNDLLMLERL